MNEVRGSLRWRLVVVGMAVVALVVVTLDVFVYFQLRDRLEDTLHVVLEGRLGVAQQLADQFGVDGLGDRLASAGVPGVVVRSDGIVEQSDPNARRFVELPPDLATELGGDVELLGTILADGTLVEVAASRAGISRTLRTIVVLEGAGSLAVVLLAGILLHRASALVLRPIDRVVTVARATAAGQTGKRLEPQDPGSELGRMTVAFNEMLDAQEEALATAREAEQRSRTFLAEAAHQLRTPVAGMKAAAEALVLTDDEGEREELATDIGIAGARAGRLVARLLRMAELDERTRRARVPTDLEELARAEVRAMSDRVARDDVEVTASGDTIAVVDDQDVREAVSNLLDNAVRHGSPPITVDVVGDESHVDVRVRDEGPGIAVADRRRVFDRFTSMHGDGTGLGLAIVLAVAEAHDGEATADERGFVLRLPRGSD